MVCVCVCVCVCVSRDSLIRCVVTALVSQPEMSWSNDFASANTGDRRRRVWSPCELGWGSRVWRRDRAAHLDAY